MYRSDSFRELPGLEKFFRSQAGPKSSPAASDSLQVVNTETFRPDISSRPSRGSRGCPAVQFTQAVKYLRIRIAAKGWPSPLPTC